MLCGHSFYHHHGAGFNPARDFTASIIKTSEYIIQFSKSVAYFNFVFQQ